MEKKNHLNQIRKSDFCVSMGAKCMWKSGENLLQFHSFAATGLYTTFSFCRPIFSDFPMNFPLCFNFEWEKSYKAGRPNQSKMNRVKI